MQHHPLPEYPRPALRRDSYENLNGLWQYAITGSAGLPAKWDGDILAVSNQVFFRVLAPLIGVTPVSLDFGEVVKDAISNLTVTVTNSGNDELNVTNIAFTGTGYASFLADYNSLTVQPGEAADITVSFEPSGGGTFAWTMTLYND